MYVALDNRGRHNVSLIETLITRIIKKESGCWEWSGTNGNGYGYVKYQGKHWPAHRLIYWLSTNEDIDGKDIHHLCENPPCVNPRHLQHATRQDHKALHGAIRLNGNCKYGHKMTPLNSYLQLGKYLSCRECRRITNREYKRKVKVQQTGNLTP